MLRGFPLPLSSSAMLSRFISKPSRHLLLLTRYISTNLSCPVYPSVPPSHSPLLLNPSRCISSPFYNHRPFSSGNGDNSNTKDPPKENLWSLSSENDELNVFGSEGVDLRGMGVEDGVEQESKGRREDPSWTTESGGAEGDVLQGLTNEFEGNGSGANEWPAAAGDDFQAWKLEEDEKEEVFDIGGVTARKKTAGGRLETLEEPEDLENKAADIAKLNEEEEKLKVVIKGPNRAFGDLIAASGITDAMLDSLMALKNFEDIEGLPPLSEIEDLRYEKTTRKSSRYEMERLKQEEAAKSRVRIVDEKDRAYGTGKRKCSIARVWVQPGEGKVLVNDKEFDVYFPMLDHRAALLRPFSETHTLGLWDVKCTVKGGGVSGQVGAIRLGISRALQNWEPGLRGQLKEAGFLTRDSRVVERKKPGKAKARKSFQWVKR